MWIVLCLGLTYGLLASSWASSTQEVKTRGCSHKGVFYVQGNERHSLNFTEAQQLCESLGATLASSNQLSTAYDAGMEICRYGWISDGNAAIVRQTSNPLCRAGLTGVITINAVNTTYDAFCYDSADVSEKNCSFAINLESTADPVPPKPKEPEVSTVLPTSAAEKNYTEAPTDDITLEAKITELPDIETPVSTTLHSEPKEVGEEDAQTTQFSILFETTEQLETTEGLTTENAAQPETQTQQTVNEDEAKDRHITSVPTLESTGSGMGEPTSKIPGSTGYWGHVFTETTTMDASDKALDSDESAASEAPKGRGRMIVPSTEDKDKNNGSSDWLIIVGVIVAVAAILLVCAAVATRKRWCGKHQTLMITSKSSSEGNGTAASASSSRAQEREQEMVTLMHKEKIQENGNTEEFTVITLEESPEKNQQA